MAAAPASLCIFRLSAIGDTTHVLPVVRTIQRHWPATAITWVVGRVEAGLVGAIPGITFRVLDKRDGLWACRRRLLALEGGRQHDCILQMQASLRASLIASVLGGRRRIGFDRHRAVDGQWLFVDERIAARPGEHVLDGFFGFLAQAGLPERELVWDLPLPPPALAFAEQNLPTDRPLLAINPCSSQRWRNYREWPVSRYAAVADYAVRQGLRVVLTGGNTAKELAYAQAIMAQTAETPVNLVGRTSLPELAAVLVRCRGLISPDSGPVHIASALDRPVIGLYATSNPQRTGPYRHRRFVVNRYPDAVQRFLGREVDGLPWGTRVRDPRAMELITVEEVCIQVDQM